MPVVDEYRENPEGYQPKFRVYVPLTWAFVWLSGHVRRILRSAAIFGHILVTWTPGDDRAEGFRIHFGTEPGKYSHYADVMGGKSTGKTIEVDTSKRWFIAMTAFNESGESPLTNEIVVGKAPKKPSKFKATRTNPAEIETVSFDSSL